VALLSTSLTQLDIIVSQRQSALVFLEVTLLAMPQLINMVMPIALFVAGLVALNRLQVDQELVVCFAGGMSRWRGISPAMRLAGTITVIALALNLWVQPAALRAMREGLFDVRTDLAATLVREGEFTQPAPGLTVYAQTIDNGGLIHNLFIHQAKDDGGATTYTAEQGRMTKIAGKPVLLMHKGSTQEFSKTGVLQFLSFDDYPFELTGFVNSTDLVHYKPSDRYLHELLFPDLTQDWEKKNREKLLAEGHGRLSTPLYNLTFMCFALWAIIGGGFSRLGYGRRIAIAAGAAAGVRILGFVIEAASEGGAWLNVLQYGVPIGGAAWALRGIFRQRVSRFIDIRRRRGAPPPAPINPARAA
jgi:lipopolysaccharide export system permease protein